MLTLSTILKHYKNREVQEAIAEHARDREVAARFGESFGARPDVIQHASDVLDFAKQGATSFHCSEERWSSPMQLAPNMRQHELDALRIGWDLIIDVDCKSWKYSKLIAALIVKLIKSFGVDSISVKFSGNKGFHIGVPFEAFPAKVHGKEIRLLFPEGPRRIAAYLIHLLEERFMQLVPIEDITKIAKELGIAQDEIIVFSCAKCGTARKAAMKRIEFICPSCGERKDSDENLKYLSCVKCSSLMVRQQHNLSGCLMCSSKDFLQKVDVSRIIDVDTLLISSRHLYRAPYSLHEKSGLVSIPIEADVIGSFEREDAAPEKIKEVRVFLPRNAKADEANHLFLQAFDYMPIKMETAQNVKEVEIPSTAIPEEYFPECVRKISNGMSDGRKRAAFVLINFLRSVGWNYEQVEKYVNEWNKKNSPPLGETYVIGQLRYAKSKKPMLPPNCDNKAYYSSIGVKCSETVCLRCKNPVNCAKRRVRMSGGKKGRKWLRKRR